MTVFDSIKYPVPDAAALFGNLGGISHIPTKIMIEWGNMVLNKLHSEKRITYDLLATEIENGDPLWPNDAITEVVLIEIGENAFTEGKKIEYKNYFRKLLIKVINEYEPI